MGSFWIKMSKRLFITSLLGLFLSVAYFWHNIVFKSLPISNAGYTIIVKPGTSLLKFTRQLAQDHLIKYPQIFRRYAELNGYANSIKAGEYWIPPTTTAKNLLNIVVYGMTVQHPVTIVEGWKSANILAVLNAEPKLQHTLQGLSEAEIIQKLNIDAPNLEGLFLPDTYYFTRDTTDLAVLRRAYQAMQKTLQTAWDNRSPDCKLGSPYEALVLASIIEKESAIHAEYPEISAVYQQRLAKNMRLQADPTVIYGLGNQLSGPLLKTHLQLDSAYNTYTRNGLPPTPIANPSRQAVHSALNPAKSENLYFVAQKDGTHLFSKNLKEHNLAVKQSRIDKND